MWPAPGAQKLSTPAATVERRGAGSDGGTEDMAIPLRPPTLLRRTARSVGSAPAQKPAEDKQHDAGASGRVAMLHARPHQARLVAGHERRQRIRRDQKIGRRDDDQDDSEKIEKRAHQRCPWDVSPGGTRTLLCGER